MLRRGFLLVAVAALVASPFAYGQSLPSQQITSAADGISERWANRNSTISGGKIVFEGSDDTLYLYTGSSIQTVQTTTGMTLRDVLMLGSGSTAGSVIAGWRRGDGVGWVDVDGGTPHMVDLNPEHVSIGAGCVFMTLQTAANGNQAYQIDPATGTKTQITTDPAAANHGAFRVYSDSCTKLAVGWLNASNLNDIQYWNGSTISTVATDIPQYNFSFAGGRMVYPKVVGGVTQVFAIDTNVSLTPIQLTSETDPTKIIVRPVTDGRHVAWYRTNGDGSNPQIVMNGGLVFPTGTLGKIDNQEFAVELNRGQLLWTNGAPGSARSFFYYDGALTYTINPSPATSIINPWLTDGSIAFLGPTATSTDNEVFRVTGTAPSDSSQPSPPMLVTVTLGSSQATLNWDLILGATSYNLYVANVPGVTRDNYASLPGGRRITGVTPPYTLAIAPNDSYSFAVSAVDGSGEGPSSHAVSTTLIGTQTWQSVGGLDTTTFYSVAADPASSFLAYAGADGSVYRSADGGITWTQTLSHATSGGTRTAALAVAGSQIFANMMSQADIWRSTNSGVNWARVLDASGFGESTGSIVVDPSNANTLYAGDFILPGKTSASSLVIKSADGGTNWSLTPEGPNIGNDEIHAYAIAIDPNHTSTLYAGGSGTPNIAKSTDGAASWNDIPISGNTGGVYSIAVDPTNSNIVYATTRDLGVYKSYDGGATWTAKNSGLAGVSTSSVTGFNSIVIDPGNANYLHLGAGNGYWYSTDGGDHWTAANNGFGTTPYIYALARTPAHRLLAGTSQGLFMLGVGPAPLVNGVSPNSDNIAGGTAVTITGSGFQPSATVAFGTTAATNVTVVSSTTITATTPAHAAGSVDVVVTNFDGQSGTLTTGFTYTNTPPAAPTGLTAAAQSTTSILVTWNAAATATSYQLDRRDDATGFHQIATPSGTSFPDTVGIGTAHLYRVRAVNSAGTSGNSTSDIATTVIFTDDPIGSNVVVKATHLDEIRNAVNAVRHIQGLDPITFADAAAPGLLIRAQHITDIRTALDAATQPLGLLTGGFTDSSLSGVVIKAIHFQEIRNRME